MADPIQLQTLLTALFAASALLALGTIAASWIAAAPHIAELRRALAQPVDGQALRASVVSRDWKAAPAPRAAIRPQPVRRPLWNELRAAA